MSTHATTTETMLPAELVGDAYSALSVTFVTVATGYLLLHVLLHLTQDSKEPPTVNNAIPFLSPILGMTFKKAKFYSLLR